MKVKDVKHKVTLDDFEHRLRFLYKGIIINHNKNRANLH